MTAMVHSVRLTAAESFWYVLGCIGFGAMYFAKVPVKKALSEVGLAQMTGAEQFWYVLQCIAFGAGYFAKVPVKKALSEMAQAPDHYQRPPAARYEAGYGRPSQAPLAAPPPGAGGYPRQGYGQQPWETALPPDQVQELPPGARHGRHQEPRQQGY